MFKGDFTVDIKAECSTMKLMRYKDRMSRNEFRDVLSRHFNDDASVFADTIGMSSKNVGNILKGAYGITSTLAVLVRLLDSHPALIDELKESAKEGTDV